jgi:SAM-dependent methyltransferase
VLEWLREDKGDDLDAPETTLRHAEIIVRKPFLRALYREWYSTFVAVSRELPPGELIELGSGGGFFRDLLPAVTTSDVLPLPNCDLVFSAEQMPFADASVAGLFMVDVLHHIPDCERFFSEVQRVLVPGGRLCMTEPANTLFSRLIYQNFHHEPFRPDADTWTFPSSGPLSGANGALPWIIFERDAVRFGELFAGLQIRDIRPHTPLRYLLSGGLSFRTPFPGWSFDWVSRLERAFDPLLPWTAMFQTVQVERKRES